MARLQLNHLTPAISLAEPAGRGRLRASGADPSRARFDDELHRADRQAASEPDTEKPSALETASYRDANDRGADREHDAGESEPHAQRDSQAEAPDESTDDAELVATSDTPEANGDSAASDTRPDDGEASEEAATTSEVDLAAAETASGDAVTQVETPELPVDQAKSSDAESPTDGGSRLNGAASNPARPNGETPQPTDAGKTSTESQQAAAQKTESSAARAAGEVTDESTESAHETHEGNARTGEPSATISAAIEEAEAVSVQTDAAELVDRTAVPGRGGEPSAEADTDQRSRRSRRRGVARGVGFDDALSRRPSASPVAPAHSGRPLPSDLRSAQVEQIVAETTELNEPAGGHAKTTTSRPAAVAEGQSGVTNIRETAPNESESAPKSLPPRGVVRADHARFVQRVSRALQTATERGGQLQLRLSPPELGSLRLEITLRDGLMRAHLEAETSAARNMLMENLPALRERLAEQGIKLERFDVDLREESQNNSAAQQERQTSADNSHQNRPSYAQAGERREADANSETTIGPANLFGDDRLNVIV